jgi:hypothetical protein
MYIYIYMYIHRYLDLFVDSGFDGGVLMAIPEDQLFVAVGELGINQIVPQYAVTNFLKKLKNRL